MAASLLTVSGDPVAAGRATIGREPVMRRMGWKQIGDAEAAKVASMVIDNLDAILAARGSSPS